MEPSLLQGQSLNLFLWSFAHFRKEELLSELLYTSSVSDMKIDL